MSLNLQPGVPKDWENYRSWDETEEKGSPREKKVHSIVDETLNEVLADLQYITVSKKTSFYKDIRNKVRKGFNKIVQFIGIGDKELLPENSKQKLVGLVTAKGNWDAASNNLTEFSETRLQTNAHKLRQELDAANAVLTQAATPLIKQLNQEPAEVKLTLSSYQNEFCSKAIKCGSQEEMAILQAIYLTQSKSKDPLISLKAKYLLAFKNVYEIQQKFDQENDQYQNAPLVKQKAKEELLKALENLQKARDAVLQDTAIKRVCRDPESFFKLFNDTDLAHRVYSQLKPIIEKTPDLKADFEKEKVQAVPGLELMEKLKKPAAAEAVETDLPLKQMSFQNLQMKLADLEYQLAICNVNERKQLISLGLQIADVKFAMLEKTKDFAIAQAEDTGDKPQLGIVQYYFTQASAINDLKLAFEQGKMSEIIKYREEISERLKKERNHLTAEASPIVQASESAEHNALEDLDALLEQSRVREGPLDVAAEPAAPVQAEKDEVTLMHEAAEKIRIQEELQAREAKQKDQLAQMESLKAFIELPGHLDLIRDFRGACTSFLECKDMDTMKKLWPNVYSYGKKLFDAQKKTGFMMNSSKYGINLRTIMTNINVKGIEVDSPLVTMLKQAILALSTESELHLQLIGAIGSNETPSEKSAGRNLIEKMENALSTSELEAPGPSSSGKLMELTSMSPDELTEHHKKNNVEGA